MFMIWKPLGNMPKWNARKSMMLSDAIRKPNGINLFKRKFRDTFSFSIFDCLKPLTRGAFRVMARTCP